MRSLNYISVFLYIVCCKFISVTESTNFKDALVLTVATDATDGYHRYLRSAKVNKIEVTTLGLGNKWNGGSMKSTGGGQKINLLKTEVEKYKNEEEKIIIFTDSYDVIYLSNLDKIVEEFKKFSAKVVFSAEAYCWPDKNLASKYPNTSRGKQYLNSGAFMGYAPEIYKMLTFEEITDDGDDQLYYTRVYLDENMRSNLNIKLDHKSQIFQNIYGAAEELEIKFRNHVAYLENVVTRTTPLILHGNGLSKVEFNTFSNYLAEGWSSGEGCISCWENTLSLQNVDETQYPTVQLSIFISKSSPFLEEFFNKLKNLRYPKQKMDVFVYNSVIYHEPLVDEFAKDKEYRSVKKITPADNIKEQQARNLAIEHFIKKKADYYFNVDSDAHLDNPHTLKLLIEQNRTVLAPLIVRPYKAWSNFWGALTDDGFYARSFDYMDIVNNEKRGVWNVPYINSCYLLNSTVIKNKETRPKFVDGNLDHDMAFCHQMREKGIFMYVTNRVDFGHLITPDSFDTTRTNPEFYQITDNKWDWEQRYLHENYSLSLEADTTPLQPCPDVYWFPIGSPRFCKELIEIMEAFGKWSDGSNTDERISGGYEAVPTRDIHMTQVGLHDHWLTFLKNYIGPLNQKVYLGYQDEPPRSTMNFVVKYRPDEQPSLRPHHDSSTYTINIALNEVHKDYEGGGCHFLRYNCSVTETKPGWLLMHPGRLTHYHEGLPVTRGTRYIMISFIDP